MRTYAFTSAAVELGKHVLQVTFSGADDLSISLECVLKPGSYPLSPGTHALADLCGVDCIRVSPDCSFVHVYMRGYAPNTGTLIPYYNFEAPTGTVTLISSNGYSDASTSPAQDASGDYEVVVDVPQTTLHLEGGASDAPTTLSLAITALDDKTHVVWMSTRECGID
jgi:hypothetical protein